MKKQIIASVIMLLPLLAGAQTYHLVWEDNFDAPALNEKNWTIQVNGDGGGNSELQYYRRENISIEQHPDENVSCLVLNAKKESFSGKTCTSGRVVTQGKVTCRYGKIEARIHLPQTANGLWPAFWMMGDDIATVGWPKCGETDILEMGNSTGISASTQNRYFNGACHWGQSGANHPMYAKATTWATSIQDEFHLFTLIWDESAIKMYLDLDQNPNAQPYYEMAISNTATLNDPGHYFHKPNHILLNLAVGGNFPGIWNINNVTALASDGTPAKMYIDYVRIYQRGVANDLLTVPGTGTAVKKPTGSKTTIHPNPASDFLILDEYEKMGEVSIFSPEGRMITKTSAPTTQLDVSSLTTGLYVLKIVYKDQSGEQFKFMKL